jgi:hypothetical protein
MLATGRKKTKQPEQKRISVKSWLKGYMSQLDDGRMPEDGLATAANVVLSQNGTVRPAPSSALYGTQPPGTVQGQVFPFTRLEGGEIVNYQCALINVAGVVQLYYQKDGLSWTAASGKTFDVAASGRFAQIKQVVLVASTTDSLCWLDTTTLTMTVQTALTNPAAPGATVTGMVGTTFSYRYRVSAVNVGETAASTAVVAQTTIQRDIWNPSTQYIDLTITRITNATGYNVYYGLTAGEEIYLGYVADPGSGATVSFRDDGSSAPDVTRVAPDTNTSAMPVLTHVRVLSDRIFGWGDSSDRWKVWYGGTGRDILKFSAFYGGGWTRIANGTAYVPNGVAMFRTGKGDPAITVFCRSSAGFGKRYLMAENTITEGDTVITYFGVQEDNGSYGTDSPDGIVMAEDDIFYPSKDSFKKTGNKVNVPNILSSKGISDIIQTDVQALNSLAMRNCVGLYFQGRIYWALPYGGATSNNQIWTLDITRGGAWMLPIDVSADWLWLYEDSDGITHFCYLSGSQVYEFTYSYATSRDGVAFPTSIGSGLIKFSDDGQEWANVQKLVFVLIRPQGNITGNVTGKTEDAPVAALGTEAFVPNTSITGLGEEALGMYYLGEARNAPVAYGSMREELEIEIDEDVKWLQWSLNSAGTGVDYELSDAILYYTLIGTKDNN